MIFGGLKTITKNLVIYTMYCIAASSFGRSGEKIMPDPRHILQCCNAAALVGLYFLKFLTPGRVVVS